MAENDDEPLLSSVEPGEVPDFTESMRLVTEAQAGDREALDALLRRYEDRIRRIVRIRLGTKMRRCVDSMDIVQDTWQAAYEHIGTLELRSTASILQWLARIAENRILDTHRHFYGLKRDKKREVRMAAHDRMEDSGVFGGVQVAGTGLPPDEDAARRELETIVDEAIALLPDEYREVIMLRTYYGGSWEEVTEQIGGVSSEAVRQLHRRARMKLAKLVRARMSTDFARGNGLGDEGSGSGGDEP